MGLSLGGARRFHSSGTFGICVFVILSFVVDRLNQSITGRFFFDYGAALLIFQMAVGLFILEIGRCLKFVDIQPYTLERGKAMFVPSLVYFADCYVSISLLQGIDTPVLSVLKRCVPIVVLVLSDQNISVWTSSANGGTNRSRNVAISVGLVTVGLVLTGFRSLECDPSSFVFGILALSLRSASLVMIDRVGTCGQYSIMDMCYLNTFNGLVLALIVDLIVDESRDALTYFLTSTTWQFSITFIAAVFASSILHWIVVYCIVRNSALTMSVVGGLKDALEFVLVRLAIGGALGFITWIGAITSVIGAGFYAICDIRRENGMLA